MSSWGVQSTVSALLCQTVVPAIACPHRTSAISCNGLHNQALKLSYPLLDSTLLLILLQTYEEWCVLS